MLCCCVQAQGGEWQRHQTEDEGCTSGFSYKPGWRKESRTAIEKLMTTATPAPADVEELRRVRVERFSLAPAPAPTPEQVHSAGAGDEPLPQGWVRYPGKDQYGQEGFYYWNT